MSRTLLALLLACLSTSATIRVEGAATFSASSSVVHFNLTEESPVGTRVGSLADHIAGAEAGTRFEIDTGPSSKRASHYLAVDLQTGALTVTNRVDRETLCAHELRAASCALTFAAALTPPGALNPDLFLKVSVDIIDRNDDRRGMRKGTVGLLVKPAIDSTRRFRSPAFFIGFSRRREHVISHVRTHSLQLPAKNLLIERTHAILIVVSHLEMNDWV
jgi:hypothetical protein